MVGLAFKSDTDDLRESPNIDLARKLIQGGYAVSIYDPSQARTSDRPKSRVRLRSPAPVDRSPGEQASRGRRDFDLVIDANGASRDLSLKCRNVIDFHEL